MQVSVSFVWGGGGVLGAGKFITRELKQKLDRS